VVWKLAKGATQETDWGKPFGWEIQYGDAKSEFKVSEKLIIKEDTGKFEKFDDKLFSPFYEKHGFHFALFAMEWCQPVYDEIEDPPVEDNNDVRSNEKAFVNNLFDYDYQWLKDMHLHIVTKYAGGENSPWGHYYGFFEYMPKLYRVRTDNPNYRHHGMDLYTGENGDLPVFAVHGGKVEKGDADPGNNQQSVAAGYYVILKIVNGESGQPYFRYLHLAEDATKFNGKYVLAGTHIAKAGRTGFNIYKEPSHLHFEFNDGTGTKRHDEINRNDIVKPPFCLSLPDGENRKFFQCNKLPLVLPCQCHLGQHKNNYAAIGCTFSKKEVLKNCWCVQEFPFTYEVLDEASHQEEAQVTKKDADQKLDYPSLFPPAASDVVRFICPHIFHNNADKGAQLQAKLRLIIENQVQTQYTVPKSQYLKDLSYRSNPPLKRTNADKIDGSPGGSTRAWIIALLRTYQDTLPDWDPNKKLTLTAANEPTSHAQKFINKYVSNTPLNDTFLEEAYTWFNNIDLKFNN
jgi:murein DD-endopeptidase MepM/ murein hydrolase activator NlpD